MTCCIITQVRNGHEYIPAFLAHHARLVDRIFLLDHNSDHDLSKLASDVVKSTRIDVESFSKDHFINYFMIKNEIRSKYDFVFVLDIDEFIPFFSREDLHYLLFSQKSYKTIEFRWKNGYLEDSDKLDANSTFRFTVNRSPTRKLLYNARKNRRFLPQEGNHNARYPVLDLGFIQARPRAVDSGLGLLHIPFVGKKGLHQKLANNPKGQFADKIIRDIAKLGIEAEGALFSELSDAQYRQIVANYRVADREQQVHVEITDFDAPIQLFKSLGPEIEFWQGELDKCPKATVRSPDPNEREALASLNIKGVGYMRRLRRTFEVDPAGRIRLAGNRSAAP